LIEQIELQNLIFKQFCEDVMNLNFLPRKLLLLVLPLLIFCESLYAQSQNFPDRLVRIVVPYPPGSGTDIAARLMAQKLTDIWKVQVVVDNRPGAGAIVGVEAVAKAIPDGYTIGIADTGPLAINPALYAKLPYHPIKDVMPITIVANIPFMLVVHPDVPAKSVQELVAYAKKNPGKLNYASVGNGSAVHLASELFKTRAGIDIVHIPYKGSALALNGLLGGETSMMFVNLLSALPLVKAGKLNMLAAATPQRISNVPDLPTVAEAGVPGYEFQAWFGLIAPAGTPKNIIEKLNADFRKVISMPEVKEFFINRGGFEPVVKVITAVSALVLVDEPKNV
jgi:tripartite-type tricarboxylate transporter receptor subunit TctC